LVTVLPLQHTVARTIAQYATPTGGDQIVMSSSGHGRSAAFLGNVATDLIVEHAGPVVVVGPAATRPKRSLRGELVVAVDGSNVDEAVLGVAADWAPRLGQRPWVVTVVDRVAPPAVDVPGNASPRDLARRLATVTGHPAESDTLQGRRPAAAIVEFAESIDASLILLGTHERTGLARLAVGSVAAAVVRHARCPVVLADPAHPRVLSMADGTPVDAVQAHHGRGVV
jgi:nucleotide-binding universal stress UspA family protein